MRALTGIAVPVCTGITNVAPDVPISRSAACAAALIIMIVTGTVTIAFRTAQHVRNSWPRQKHDIGLEYANIANKLITANQAAGRGLKPLTRQPDNLVYKGSGLTSRPD